MQSMQSNEEKYQRALELRDCAVADHAAYVASRGTDESAHQRIRASVRPGLYEHWKSADRNLKYYVVFGVGTEQDTHQPLVTYAALYRPHQGTMTFRHLFDEERGFLSPIDRTVYKGPRFEMICPLSLGEIFVLLQNADGLSLVKESPEFRLRVGKILKKNIPLF